MSLFLTLLGIIGPQLMKYAAAKDDEERLREQQRARNKRIAITIVLIIFAVMAVFGIRHIMRTESDKAIMSYNKILKKNPYNIEVLVKRGTLYYEQKKYEEAIIDWTTLSMINPQNKEAIANRANSYAALGQYENAIADYNSILNQDPSNVNILMLRADLYTANGEADAAVNDYLTIFTLIPPDAANYVKRADLYLTLNKQKEAVEDYAEALRLDKSNYDAFFSYAAANQETNKALTLITAILMVYPNDIQAIKLRADIASNKKEYNEAILDYSKIIALNPIDNYYIQRADIYLALDKQKEAVEDYVKALNLNNSNYDLFFDYADEHIEDNKSLALVTAILAVNPNDAPAIKLRGDIASNKKEYNQAFAEYSKAITINPNFIGAIIKRGNILLFDMKEYKKALGDYIHIPKALWHKGLHLVGIE